MPKNELLGQEILELKASLALIDAFNKTLRAEMDAIMAITHADKELPYSELATHVYEWGNGQYEEGILKAIDIAKGRA